MAQDTSSGEYDFLFEYVLQFLKSPLWTTPLQSFIDEYCLVFDGAEENAFNQTEIHEEFKKLVEGLLSSHLSAIGVSDEQFVEACAKGHNQELNKRVFGQILAIDDFLTFKKMMSNRNEELNAEAMRQIDELQAQPHSDTAVATPSAPPQETLREPEVGEEAPVPAPSPGMTEMEMMQLEAVIQASIEEEERRQRLLEDEDEELERAIALSLQLEQERRAAEAEAEAEAAAAADGRDEEEDTPAPAKIPVLPPVRLVKEPKQLPPMGKLPPLAGAGGSSRPLPVQPRGGRAVAPIMATQTNEERRRREAEAAAARLKQQETGLSEQDLAARREFLRRQRDAIIRRKAAERELALKKFKLATLQGESGEVASSTDSPAPDSTADGEAEPEGDSLAKAHLAERIRDHILNMSEQERRKRENQSAASAAGQHLEAEAERRRRERELTRAAQQEEERRRREEAALHKHLRKMSGGSDDA